MSKSLLKLGLGTLVAFSTLLAPATTHAAGRLCIYSFTNQSGASHCNKICNPPA
jgi:hypothetical protein